MASFHGSDIPPGIDATCYHPGAYGASQPADELAGGAQKNSSYPAMATPLPQRVPENSPGDFYVERDVCLRCCLPHGEAPELLDDPEEGAPSCYFRRQPENEVEIEHALR